ncbi:MAG: regulatory protein RecX [Dehalococcoidia bacterium]
MDDPHSPAAIVTIRGSARRMRILALSDGREVIFSDEACERVGIAAGDAATDQLLAALDAAEHRVNAHEAALRLLGHRARSERELRTRLGMRGIPPEAVDDEVVRLRAAGLLDDHRFAEAWVQDRQRFAPRGRRMLRYELLGRGVAPESVDSVTHEIDDVATARDLALAKARRTTKEPYEDFLVRVGGFLRRRGFDYAVASQAAREAWVEAGHGAEPEIGSALDDA